MTLWRTLLAYGASVAVVSFVVVLGMYFNGAPQYRTALTFGLLPAVLVIVILTTAVPVLFLRIWAARHGWSGYRHAAIAGAALGALGYSGFAGLINGREMLDEPGLAVTVLASGIALGVVGGSVFLAVERWLAASGPGRRA